MNDIFNRDYIFDIEFTIEQSAMNKKITVEILEDINYPITPVIFAIKHWINKNICIQ